MCARVAGLLLSVTLLTANVVSAENTPDYDAFDEMLLKNVRNGFIDYDGMSADPRFEVVVTQIGAGDDAALRTDADRLAFYVNAYNALAIKGILNGYSPRTLWGRSPDRPAFRGNSNTDSSA